MVMMTSGPGHKKTTQRRCQPRPDGMRIDLLPKVECWNCGETVMYGELPPPGQGGWIVVLCNRSNCRAHNWISV